MTAYETCRCCNGSGMADFGDSIGDCPQCHGDCVVRARDARGRFTTLPDSEVQP